MSQSFAQAAAAAHEVARWVPPVARVGYAAKGVVYGLVGVLAIKAGMASGQAEGTTGALRSLADENGGQAMLMLIALGLAGHVVWRAVQASLDPEGGHADAKRVAMRLFYLLSAVIYASLALTAWQLSGDGQAGDGEGKAAWIAQVLDKPFGATLVMLVMLVGIGIAGYGLQQLWKAWQGDVNKHMATSPQASRSVRALGRIGIAARGLVFLPIAWFVFNAGRYYRAEEAADTGEVLKMIEHGGLLAAMGIGLLAYGLHQLAKARYRRIQRPS